MDNIGDLVKLLKLQTHPEGGWYKEVYRSKEKIDHLALPIRFGGDRAYSTAIYFLLPAGVFSAFHRIASDECWHFYEGAPLHIHVIHPDGTYKKIRLGSDLMAGESFQAMVPAGCWFASMPQGDDGYTLCGCTVAPGFDFADFELANADALSKEYPKHEELIRQFCR